MSYSEREKFFGENWHAFNDAVQELLRQDTSDVVDTPDVCTIGDYTEGVCGLPPDLATVTAAIYACFDTVPSDEFGKCEVTVARTAVITAVMELIETWGEWEVPPVALEFVNTVIDDSRDNATLRAAVAGVSSAWETVRRWADSAGKNPPKFGG